MKLFRATSSSKFFSRSILSICSFARCLYPDLISPLLRNLRTETDRSRTRTAIIHEVKIQNIFENLGSFRTDRLPHMAVRGSLPRPKYTSTITNNQIHSFLWTLFLRISIVYHEVVFPDRSLSASVRYFQFLLVRCVRLLPEYC